MTSNSVYLFHPLASACAPVSFKLQGCKELLKFPIAGHRLNRYIFLQTCNFWQFLYMWNILAHKYQTTTYRATFLQVPHETT